MRRSLHVRIAAIGVAVMALTLVIVAALTYEQIRSGDRAEIDQLLMQELRAVRDGLPAELRAAAGPDGITGATEADLAVQRFLAVHPGSRRHLTIIEIGAQQFSTRAGPADVEELQQNGELPSGTAGTLQTVDSESGPLRILKAPIVADSGQLGDVTVIGSLSAGRAQATEALVRIALAGLIGLAVGALTLLLAVRRALQPVGALAAAASSADLSDLGARVPEPRRSDEVGLMAQEFNRMLARIGTDHERSQQLLSAVSHELRTPLAVARGHLEMFETLGPSKGNTAADTAAVVRRELDRLSRVVDDLTAISRGDLGRETAREPVFVPDVLADLRSRIDGLGLDNVHFGESAHVVILGDDDRLTQALLNLVVNADTHTPDGTRTDVTTRVADGKVVFEVTDDGPGIDAEILGTVFDPFVTTRTGGPERTSGLGLSVVKAITEAQGGNVHARSDRDGTTIALRLPIDSRS